MIVDKQTDKVIEATLNDDEGAIDLSNATVELRIWNDDNVLIEKSTEDDSITITNASEGKIEFKLTSEDTDITPGKYVYELLLKDVENNRYIPSTGLLTVNRNKTSEVN